LKASSSRWVYRRLSWFSDTDACVSILKASSSRCGLPAQTVYHDRADAARLDLEGVEQPLGGVPEKS
jgi:hypothetical protein